MEIDTHIGCAMSGLIADARTLVEKARVEAQNYRFSYNETLSVESLTQAICDHSIQFGDSEAKMSRPFGVSLLIAGVDETGTHLFQTDPRGTFVKYACGSTSYFGIVLILIRLGRYDAMAIGAGQEGAQSSLQVHIASHVVTVKSLPELCWLSTMIFYIINVTVVPI